jgi:hypothetical protein
LIKIFSLFYLKSINKITNDIDNYYRNLKRRQVEKNLITFERKVIATCGFHHSIEDSRGTHVDGWKWFPKAAFQASCSRRNRGQTSKSFRGKFFH